ncbi:hypothetical protein DICVIV_10414 [Dictyocaulus viviparus]|uniref:Uncharacterized protein n=1 Tax=Dictyocaulus viviparus TaxID=29172 RepID=A0A0D8XFV7_DICVI|nr:hypothetical protein DICVIV_10414 [Dictyocaulus viviparus]
MRDEERHVPGVQRRHVDPLNKSVNATSHLFTSAYILAGYRDRLIVVCIESQTIGHLALHGESEYNRIGRLGGDSPLSENGKKFAECLKDYFTIRSILGILQIKFIQSAIRIIFEELYHTSPIRTGKRFPLPEVESRL